MEIYKLSDEITEKNPVHLTKKHKCDIMRGEASEDAGAFDGSELKITDIKQAVRNENRVNVHVNGKYAFSLDVAQVVEMGVKIGRIISEDELADFKKASEYGKAYQRALEWVLMRPRSRQELKEYLRRREIQGEAKERKKEWERDKEMADIIARGEEVSAKRLMRRAERVKNRVKYDFKGLIEERLVERGYVDDAKFARYYVENRFVKKGISRKRLKMELVKKGIAQDVIDDVLGGRNDEEEILKIIAKKRTKYDDKKLIAYLCRQGFDYQLANSLLRTCEKD